MDMYMFGHWPMPMQGCCEAVGTTATNSRYDLDISASPEPTPAKAGFQSAHLLRLVTKGDGNADLCSGGRPAAPSFSSSRFECGSLCLQLQAKKKGSMGL